MQINNFAEKIAHWESWDWRIKYIPIVPAWVWNCIRARSFWFFTPSNPKLAYGGFEGVTKMSIYKHLPAKYYPHTLPIPPGLTFPELEQLTSEHFTFPFVLKPDVGRMGFMFRIINSPAQLAAYHEAMPFNYIAQELVTYSIEVSVFYYRFPKEKSGVITGFVRKEFLEICGDGKSTVEELMNADSRVKMRVHELKSKHQDKLQTVLEKGEIFCLSHALNLSRGCRLVSLEHEKSNSLLKVFDEISSYSDTLFYGRYDIKCASIEDLKQGKNFSIIEYNGCGAEPHHVYGNENSLFKACRILAQHWQILYEVSKQNHKLGVPYDSFKKGWNTMISCRKYFAKLKKIDASFPEF